MDIQENVSLKGKTTMRIGGSAAYYCELQSKEDVTAAQAFAAEKNIPMILLGGGANTIFADGTINALVARISAADVQVDDATVTVEAGKNLPQLINELAEQGLDLSALTGILGTVGGAVFGNAGQGPKGIWIDTYIESVDIFMDDEWKTFFNVECGFSYRESIFKRISPAPIIWSVTLNVPQKDPAEIKAEIEKLLQKRIDTQPHVKTAGSCFKAVGGQPAWQLIDEAGLRDTAAGGIHISPKHANFLINDGEGTFNDAVEVVETVQRGTPDDLEVEMRFVKEDGSLAF